MSNDLAKSTTTAQVVESMVLRGDISGLTPEDKMTYYHESCAALGLAAATQPFAVLKFQGKEVLYPTRTATDQLAMIHKLSREIIDGPKVIDVGGTKMIYAVCKATHPNGRVETAVATVPMNDPLNGLMKAETKAKRRATLSILSLARFDEPGSDEPLPAVAVDVTVTTPVVPSMPEAPTGPVQCEPPIPPELAEFAVAAKACATLGNAVTLWLERREQFGDETLRANAWTLLVDALWETSAFASGKRVMAIRSLKKALGAAEASHERY